MDYAADTGPPLHPPPSGARCREISGTAINALLSLIDEIAVDGKVDQRAIHRIAEAILSANGPLGPAYSHTEQRCMYAFHRAAIECQRQDVLGRLVVHPFAHLLDQRDGMERTRLGQFLHAVRMMVGEEDQERLRTEVTALADAHRGVDGFVDWDRLHADPAARLILEHVLVSMATSFRRFEARRDWFLVIMNANPSSISTASNAFVTLKPEERAKFAFTESHMARVFDALFSSVRPENYLGDDLRRFGKRWNATPEKLFGPLFLGIAHSRQKTG